MSRGNCFFCNADADIELMDAIKVSHFVKCPICGRYEVSDRFIRAAHKDRVAAYLYHHEKEKREHSDLFFYFLGEESDYNKNLHNINIPMYINKGFSIFIYRAIIRLIITNCQTLS